MSSNEDLPLFPEVDHEVVVSEILMLRAESNNTVLMVEGGSDEKLFWNFVDHDSCFIVISEGKANALAAMLVVDSEGTPGVVCVVDQDFDPYLGINHANDNVVVTDHHDLEQIILHSTALEKVLQEVGSKGKIAKLIASGRSPLHVIQEAAYAVALLRFVSLRDGLHLKFEGLNLKAFDRRTLVVDEAKLCQDLKNHSRSPISRDELLARMRAARSPMHVRHTFCCGHDATLLLGKALQSLIGSKDARQVESDEMELRLRLAFGWEQFKKCKIYDDLRAWEGRNPGYVVLAAAA